MLVSIWLNRTTSCISFCSAWLMAAETGSFPCNFLPMARPVWAACHHSTYFFCTTRIISTALATDFLFHSQHFSEPPAVCFTIIFDILSEEDLKRKLDGALQIHLLEFMYGYFMEGHMRFIYNVVEQITFIQERNLQ